MRLDSDVLILGGGCAGLSLAAALATYAPKLSVHILEQRTAYVCDRTWCFWNTEPHLFTAAVTHRWHSWRTRYKEREARQHSRRYTYDHIPASRFYDLSQHRLLQAGYQLSMGVAVQLVKRHEQYCEVATEAGQLRSTYVFDARPRAATASTPILLQRFEGWHVRTERACFDPKVVDLMDFMPSDLPQRTAFFYVLPFSPNEALVEATYLDHPSLPSADAAAAIARYLYDRKSGNYQILYRETGALAMGERQKTPPQHGKIFDIGTRGGRVKPSSGYAFLRIQRQSLALAKALGQGAPLPQRVEPPVFSVLDRVFLRALQERPDRAPNYFLDLFSRSASDTLVRFLSEAATPTEILRVMWALPKADFLRAALGKGGREAA